MRISTKARMNRMFANGGCLDVAIDHGVCNEPSFLAGLEDMERVVGMLIDGKLMRYLNPKLMDWAAQNTFFAGAVGLAILSAYALWASRNDSRGTAA